MKITKDHELAMDYLPICGRWFSEAQLIQFTKLGDRTCGVYAELVKAGYAERRSIPILHGLTILGEAVRIYRTNPWTLNRFENMLRYQRAQDQKAEAARG